MSFFADRRARIAWIVVLLFPVLLNSAQLLNVFKADPVLSFSALQTGIVPGPLDIHANFDPSIGIVFQPLGRRSAEEMLSGRLPWWNSYQGIGAPLAGEMSPGSFFPLIFLELLPNGQTILDVAVQILAGVFMLLLARRLGFGPVAAGAAGVLFEANGTFAWLNAGWCYPLPFLPLLIYGVELTFGPSSRERIAGTVLVAVAVAVSISAAMIEVAYLDSLLAFAWAILRLAERRGRDIVEPIVRMTAGAGIGMFLAAPLLVAFGDFLRISYVGMHTLHTGAANMDLRPLAQMIAPYIIGPVFYHDSGYAGIAVALAAVCGLFGRYLRSVRILLGAWVFVSFGATIGLPIVQEAFAKIPGVGYTAYGRYIDGSWEFALALLCAFFLHDLADVATDVARLWIRYATATAAIAGTVLAGLAGASAITHASFARPDYAVWCWTSVGWCVSGIALLWLLTVRAGSRALRVSAVAAVLGIEATVNYAIPTFGYPVQGKIVDGSAAFLRQHLGVERSFTFGPIAQQYGSYFHVYELDDAELPVAKNWADYIQSHLDPETNQGWIGGQHPEEIAKNIDALEEAGTKYVFTFAGSPPFANFYEPVSPDVAGQVVNFPDGNDPMHARLDGVPAGSLAAVAVVEDNNGGTANGFFSVRVCADGRCVDGHRPFSEAPNNGLFSVELDRPLIVRSGRVDIGMSQDGATVNDAIWLYAPNTGSNETLTSDGKVLQGQIAHVALAYGSIAGDAVAPQTQAASGKHVTTTVVAVPGDVTRFVTAVGLTGAGKTSGKPGSITACSMGACAVAVASGGRDDGRTAWYAFARALPAKTSLAISSGNRAAAPQGIRLELSAEHPTSVYRDSLVEVFEMPHPAPYFTAPGCVVVPRDRERLAAQCSAASTLTRRELFMPGWTATVDDAPVPVTQIGDVYQSIPLPAGPSFIDFSFTPPFMEYGYAAFWLALLTLSYQIVAWVRLRRGHASSRVREPAAA